VATSIAAPRFPLVLLWWYAVMLVSAAAAAALSFTALRDLALYTGAPTETAWLVPIAIDMAAAGALTVYVRSDPPDRFAQAVSVGVLLVTSVGNALAHVYAVEVSGIQPVAPTEIVVAVGVIAPLVLIVNAHLFAHQRRKDAHRAGLRMDGAGLGSAASRRGGRDPAGRRVPGRPREPAGAVAVGDPSAAGDQGDRGVAGGNGTGNRRLRNAHPPTLDELVARLRADDLTHLSANEIKTRFGVGKEKALAAQTAARQETP
jgi:hypothetical protein